MTTNIKRYMTVCILAGVMCLVALPALSDDSVGVMTKETLKNKLGSDGLTVLDVRSGRDWNSSEFIIQGAQRTAPGDFDQWSDDFAKNATLVLYCA